jgi:nucleotide-binding universal stress UspA family protein
MEHFGYDRILIPTDLTEFSRLAVQYGVLFQERLGTAITLMYADELAFPVEVLEMPVGYYAENAPASRAKLHEKLRAFAKENVPHGAEALVVQDAPARATVHAAKDTRADLIIMGTHGRAGIRRAVLGSVTESVLHDTKVPLLTVTPNLMKPSATPAITKVLCPVNFTRVARAALQHACTVAEAFNAELTVVYVAEEVAEPQVKEVENAFLQWVDPHVRERCSYSRIVSVHDDAAARVLELSTECGADLLVIGAQQRRFSDATIFGSTTDRLTRFAHCPVLTVTRGVVVEEHIQEKMLVAG